MKIFFGKARTLFQQCVALMYRHLNRCPDCGELLPTSEVPLEAGVSFVAVIPACKRCGWRRSDVPHEQGSYEALQRHFASPN